MIGPKLRLAVAALFLSLLSSPMSAEPPRLSLSLGIPSVGGGTETYLRYTDRARFWVLQPVYGLSLSTRGTAWAGAGLALTLRPDQGNLFLRTNSMVGAYKRGNGPDLGGPIQFRNGLDFGLTFANGAELGLGIDHRSNAGLYRINGGINTGYLFYSMALR